MGLAGFFFFAYGLDWVANPIGADGHGRRHDRPKVWQKRAVRLGTWSWLAVSRPTMADRQISLLS